MRDRAGDLGTLRTDIEIESWRRHGGVSIYLRRRCGVSNCVATKSEALLAANPVPNGVSGLGNARSAPLSDRQKEPVWQAFAETSLEK
jgi:hypothetical protein